MRFWRDCADAQARLIIRWSPTLWWPISCADWNIIQHPCLLISFSFISERVFTCLMYILISCHDNQQWQSHWCDCGRRNYNLFIPTWTFHLMRFICLCWCFASQSTFFSYVWTFCNCARLRVEISILLWRFNSSCRWTKMFTFFKFWSSKNIGRLGKFICVLVPMVKEIALQLVLIKFFTSHQQSFVLKERVFLGWTSPKLG